MRDGSSLFIGSIAFLAVDSIIAKRTRPLSLSFEESDFFSSTYPFAFVDLFLEACLEATFFLVTDE